MLALKHRANGDTTPPERSHPDEIIQAVAGAPLFSGIDRADVAGILSAFDEQSFNAGHRITLEGLRGSEFYVIARGRARVVADGRRVAELGPGDFFGELAVLGDGMRSATVEAETPLRCLVLPNNGLEELLVRHPRLGVNLLRVVVSRFRELVDRPAITLRLIDR